MSRLTAAETYLSRTACGFDVIIDVKRRRKQQQQQQQQQH